MHLKSCPRIQGAAWRRLDNTAKLFAAVSGEDLSSVFRIAAVLKEPVEPELLHKALLLTLPEFENFRVKLRKGFFWYYFETNNRDPVVECALPLYRSPPGREVSIPRELLWLPDQF